MENKTSKRKSGMVKLRDGFSDRNGLVSINRVQQINEFDDETRIRINNKLWEALSLVFDNQNAFLYLFPGKGVEHAFCESILNDAFCANNICTKEEYLVWEKVYKNNIKPVILQAEYNEILDIIQYSCQWVDKVSKKNKDFLYQLFNTFFEKECIGYRFIDGYIVQITDKVELDEIVEACNNPYDGARSHMKKAVQFLADRETKDYKNCIKEAISAVESICQIITGNNKATLGDALKVIAKKGDLHSALKEGFSKLYGYTSDQGGIRHAEGLFESNVTFNEAKYMLVSCSAFVNYLIAEYATGSN